MRSSSLENPSAPRKIGGRERAGEATGEVTGEGGKTFEKVFPPSPRPPSSLSKLFNFWERCGVFGGRGLFGGLLFGGRLRERHAAGGRAPGKLRSQGGVRRDCRPGFGKAASSARRASSGAPSAQAERRGAFGQKRVSLPGMRGACRQRASGMLSADEGRCGVLGP